MIFLYDFIFFKGEKQNYLIILFEGSRYIKDVEEFLSSIINLYFSVVDIHFSSIQTRINYRGKKM